VSRTALFDASWGICTYKLIKNKQFKIRKHSRSDTRNEIQETFHQFVSNYDKKKKKT
jgi:hypothetical protein